MCLFMWSVIQFWYKREKANACWCGSVCFRPHVCATLLERTKVHPPQLLGKRDPGTNKYSSIFYIKKNISVFSAYWPPLSCPRL